MTLFIKFLPGSAQNSLPTNIRAIWYDCGSSTVSDGPPTMFMTEPNDVILQNVRKWGFNHVFMNVSLLHYNDSVNAFNLGLNATLPGYKEKLVDFIDKAEAMNIKVYAVPAFENYWILPAYQNRALKKLSHLNLLSKQRH